MKFNLKWVLAAVVVALVGLAAAPWTVSQSAQIDAIKKEIRASADARLVSHGRSVFAMLPRPHIRIYDADLDFRDGAATIAASSLRVDLGFSGLFTGRLNLARVVLADAVVTLDPARARIEGPIAGAGGWGAPPGEVEATNARLLVKPPGENQPELVADSCDARLDFSRASAPLSLIGHCLLPMLGDNAAPTRYAIWLAKPDKLARGEESPLTFRAEGDHYQINLNGVLGLQPKPHFHGQVAGLAPSLRQVAEWFDLTLPLPGRYRDFSIKGEATIEPSDLSFPSLALTIDGNALDGAASVRFDGPRPQISATLAGSEVNLDPMFEDVPAPSSGGQWSREPFAHSHHLAAADLDLRLSATHARLGEFQADNVAVSAILKNGRLDLSLAEASAYSGQARARAIIAESGEGLDVRGSASVEKLDAAAFLWDVFHRQSLSGTARAAISFETSGDSFYDFASRLDARGDFSVDAGEVYGLDLALAFRRMERQPLTAGVELRSGRSSFDQLSAKFNIGQGLAEFEEGIARDERTTVYFSGRAQIADRTLELHAVATRASAAAPDAKPLQIGFTLSGGWDDAVLTPDALGLIQRSDAAAPLLPKPPQN